MHHSGNRYSGMPFSTRSPVFSVHGMAATSVPLVTDIALDILKAGGNAVDAAIAANAAIGLMEPTGNGIGGDLFAMVWNNTEKRLYGLNGSGRSPMGLSREQLLADLEGQPTIPSHGPLPISVPGTVDAWFELHDRFGSLDMDQLLAPAIQHARDGFPVAPYIANSWRNTLVSYRSPERQFNITTRGQYPDAFNSFEQVFGGPSGNGPQVGEVFQNPFLADTLEAIAQGGREAFYSGELADAMEQWAQGVGCYLRRADFVNHTSTWVEPVRVSYRGYDVWELPPNGQGIAALQQLNILEGFDLVEMGFNSADYLHGVCPLDRIPLHINGEFPLFSELGCFRSRGHPPVHIEAKKLAFEDRAKYYADPDFANIPVEQLLSKEYAAERRALIDMRRAMDRIDAGNVALRQGDTIYLTTADEEGNMVSLIQSNYRGMGSAMAPTHADGTPLGFAMQDRGEMFSLMPDHFNTYAPGKRPFHTIIPAFVTKDNEAWMSFGLMGGGMQPQGHAQIITNMIDFGMNVQDAGDAARYSHSGSSEPTDYVMTDGGYVRPTQLHFVCKLQGLSFSDSHNRPGRSGTRCVRPGPQRAEVARPRRARAHWRRVRRLPGHPQGRQRRLGWGEREPKRWPRCRLLRKHQNMTDSSDLNARVTLYFPSWRLLKSIDDYLEPMTGIEVEILPVAAAASIRQLLVMVLVWV